MALVIKVILLGFKNVGKTSLFNRFVYDQFGDTQMTLGAYFSEKSIKVDNRSTKLAIWDTAGEEKFDSLTNFYCRGSQAALVCYDITNLESFVGLQRWVDKVKEFAEGCAILLVGTKLDLVEQKKANRQVKLSEAQKFAESVQARVIETSAKLGTNINECFLEVTKFYMDRNADALMTSQKRAFPQPVKQSTQNSGCCKS